MITITKEILESIETKIQECAATRYREVPDYTVDGIINAVCKGYPCGSFLQAVFSNDLMEACGRADANNNRCIYGIVGIIYNAVPRAALFGGLAEWQKAVRELTTNKGQ